MTHGFGWDGYPVVAGYDCLRIRVAQLKDSGMTAKGLGYVGFNPAKP